MSVTGLLRTTRERGITKDDGARRGASMMGPGYTHWYGMYEVGKNYYFEFLPEVVKSSG